MPIPISCPSCGTALSAPDSAAGRTVKCPKCSTPFTVADAGEQPRGSVVPFSARHAGPPRQDYQEYDDEDRGYRRSYRREAPSGSGTGVQLGMGIASLSVGAAGLVIGMIPCIGFIPGLAAGGIGLVLGIVGLIVAMTQQGRGIAFPIAGAATSVIALLVTCFWYYWIVRGVNNTIDRGLQFAQQAQQAQQNMPRPKVGPPAPAGALLLNNGSGKLEGELTPFDLFDRLQAGSRCKIYTVLFEAQKTYQIDLMSDQFDAYLRLENPAAMPLVANDDGGEGRNARILYTCPQAGTYRIVATTFGPGTGRFTLAVQRK